ncbi:MAG: hypothetical protein M1836_005476 [Candelina mexicana]|nr:MAG: hypothetical protein M1836_005476 [Candelina mexicana]
MDTLGHHRAGTSYHEEGMLNPERSLGYDHALNSAANSAVRPTSPSILQPGRHSSVLSLHGCEASNREHSEQHEILNPKDSVDVTEKQNDFDTTMLEEKKAARRSAVTGVVNKW